ncbi:hypothetical protein FSARC_9066 [Fusarium sarcochroum]|uniref:Uncharacterized protein n=1 Tax=Fusarium sarcochroum TaxID=1208366 RepID=A0A8H4TRR0_9HYPO|nr:hypothetical protein FSARC_9066 [Fusarium sarcochroum]
MVLLPEDVLAILADPEPSKGETSRGPVSARQRTGPMQTLEDATYYCSVGSWQGPETSGPMTAFISPAFEASHRSTRRQSLMQNLTSTERGGRRRGRQRRQESRSLDSRNVVREEGGAVPQETEEGVGKKSMIGASMGGKQVIADFALQCGDEGII